MDLGLYPSRCLQCPSTRILWPEIKAEHVILTDASMKGLGAVLLQEGKPVIYVSRTLTPAEERYYNIERGLLGVVFAMERLHNDVFGEPVRVQKDHKPLEMIWKKSIATASPRTTQLQTPLSQTSPTQSRWMWFQCVTSLQLFQLQTTDLTEPELPPLLIQPSTS